jgi:hypothetical protein
VAANMRAGDPRLLDLPSRVLLRFQGRAAVDNAVIKADLERLLSGSAPAAGVVPEGQAPATDGGSGAEGGGLDFSKPPGG